ncbi:hypothetical protein P9265_01230 [Schinkia azotoformans]|uniref:hypothetical protein n=1 Tax=Schinkia azotoformans TaxID=1454 RepID=UPI002E23BC43|nr:hypothetical protein [Schinkia azotoformans]
MNILYAKYNRDRKPPFQIATIFRENNNKIEVVKKPLTKEAKLHLRTMVHNYNLITGSIRNNSELSLEVAPPKVADGCVFFPYYNGRTFSNILLDALYLNQRDIFYKYLYVFRDIVVNKFNNTFFEDVPTSVLSLEIFGDEIKNLKNKYCSTIYNLDLNLLNTMQSDEKIILLDYEWVFNIRVPVEFTIFRAIYDFYYSNNVEEFGLDINEIYIKLGINIDDTYIYKKMFENVNNFITIKNKKSYVKKRTLLISWEELLNSKEYYSYHYNEMRDFFNKDLTQRLSELHDQYIYIWGTGKASLMTTHFIRENYKNIKINGYIDNDRNKWGDSFEGKIIYSPESIINQEIKTYFIIIGSSYYREISNQLIKNNLNYYMDYCIGLHYK